MPHETAGVAGCSSHEIDAKKTIFTPSNFFAVEIEALPAAEKSQRQLAAAWAALKRGKRPARPNDDLPKQEL